VRQAVAALLLVCACGAAAADASLGLPMPKAPPAAQEALGRMLFFDRRLSANGTLSCAMCHVPEQGFTVNEARTSVGMNGVSLRRNAPTLLNVAFVERLFHDGRAASLEAQALQPLVHPDEMANPSLAAVMARIDALGEYRVPMRRAFGSPHATPRRVAVALAAYQRTLVAGGSPFDRWHFGGERGAMSQRAQRGFVLFQERGCADCHRIGEREALFSDGGFHNIGVRARSEALAEQPVDVMLVPGLSTQVTPRTLRTIGVADAADLGREEVTGRAADRRAFRTPTLRNVALTAPYMHDGSLATLDEVLDHYVRGGWPADAAQDPRIRPVPLDAADREALLAFLEALTSPAAWPSSRPDTAR
jgi:cytochrome c peroxidase